YRAASHGRARHFGDRQLWPRKEIQDESRDDRVADRTPAAQPSSVPDREPRAPIGDLLPRMSNVALGRVEAPNLARRSHFENRLAERSCATANVQPAASCRYR